MLVDESDFIFYLAVAQLVRAREGTHNPLVAGVKGAAGREPL